MTKEFHITFTEFASNVAAIFDRIARSKETVVVEREGAEVAVIKPAVAGRSTHAGLEVKPLTQAQVRQGLKALEQARAFREALSARRGGRLFSDSAALIRQARKERDEHLAGL